LWASNFAFDSWFEARETSAVRRFCSNRKSNATLPKYMVFQLFAVFLFLVMQPSGSRVTIGWPSDTKFHSSQNAPTSLDPVAQAPQVASLVT